MKRRFFRNQIDYDNMGRFLIIPGFHRIYVNVISGGSVWQCGGPENYEEHKKGLTDYYKLMNIAIEKAREGRLVHLLPVLRQKDPYRLFVFNGGKPKKCPDLKIDTEFYEVKHPGMKIHLNKLVNNINDGATQADNVIIDLPVDMPDQYPGDLLEDISRGRFLKLLDLKRIEFRFRGEYAVFLRPGKS
jgi:hypothetical protein